MPKRPSRSIQLTPLNEELQKNGRGSKLQTLKNETGSNARPKDARRVSLKSKASVTRPNSKSKVNMDQNSPMNEAQTVQQDDSSELGEHVRALALGRPFKLKKENCSFCTQYLQFKGQ